MAISRIAQGGADTNIATVAGVSPGDRVIVFAHRGSTSTIPSLPGIATNIATVQGTGSGDDCATRVGYIDVPGGGLADTGTWTNADRVLWIALRADDILSFGNITVVGSVASGAIIRYGALTLTLGVDDQWLIGFGGRTLAGLNTSVDNAPSGMTLHVERPAGAGTDCALFSTDATRVTDWPQTDVAQDGISTTYTSVVLEVVESTSMPPLAPEVTIEGGPGFAHFHTGEFQPHPGDPTDTHQSTKYQLDDTDGTFGSLVVDVDLGAPNLDDYRAEGLAAGTYYGRVAHVGENFDGAWSETITVEVTAGVTVGDTPSLSPVDETQDAITVSISAYNHTDGEVEPPMDPDSPAPYLAYSEIQIRTTASGSWAAGNILETIIVPYIDGNLTAEFDGRAPGTSHTLRGRQFDGHLNVFTAWSADLVRSTDATPTDTPLEPTIDSITCGRDVTITGSTFAHETTGTHAGTRVRMCYGANCQVLTYSTALTSVTIEDLPGGSPTFEIAYKDNVGAWGPYSDPESCNIAGYPTTVVFTDPGHGAVITANQPVEWYAPDPTSVGWHWDGRISGDGGVSWANVFTDQVAATYTFLVAGRSNRDYLLGVRVRNPDTDEVGEWSVLPLILNRTGIGSFHRHFADYESNGDVSDEWEQILDGPEHITFSLRDSYDPDEEELFRVGLEARNVHSGSTVRRSGFKFLPGGQPDEFDLFVAYEAIAEKCQWYPYQFATPEPTRAGSLMFGSDEAGDRNAFLSLMAWGAGWYLGDQMQCVSDAFREYASAFSAKYANLPGNTGQSFRYGRALTPGRFYTVADRSATGVLQHTSTGMSSTTTDRVGGGQFYTDEDGVLGRGRQIYVMRQSVRRGVDGSDVGWTIVTRIFGPGTSLSRTQFVRELDTLGGSFPGGRALICGAVGLAYEDLDRIGVGRSEGVIFTDFALNVISYGSCEPPPGTVVGCLADWRFTTFKPDDVTPQYGVADAEGNVGEADYYDDRSCPRPYLMPPRDFSETEIDYAAGASRIGSIRVGVEDKRLTPADQDTGIVTAIIDDCIGRRAVLERWREDLGYVTVFDGVIESVEMDEQLVVYWFNLRDPREREREVPMFDRNETFSVYPEVGPIAAYGIFPNPNDGYLIAPVAYADSQEFHLLTPGPGDQGVHYGYVRLSEVSAKHVERWAYPIGFGTLDAANNRQIFPDVTIRWRTLAGSTWTYLRNMPAPLSPGYGSILAGTLLTDNVVMSTGVLSTPALFLSSEVAGDLPTDGVAFEFQILAARTTEGTPYMWDGGTFGDLLKLTYDGEFTENPPRIRYNEARLDAWALETPRARFIAREPVENMREWVQENIYAPLGWAPSFDEDMRIVPSEWEMPSSDEELVELTPDEIVPVGSFSIDTASVINRVSYTYIREGLLPDGSTLLSRIVLGQDTLSPYERLYEKETSHIGILGDPEDPESSTSLFGTKEIKYKPITVRGFVAQGLFGGALESVTGASLPEQLAQKITENVLSRFGWGAHEFSALIRSGMAHGPSFDPLTLDLVVGQWLKVYVPWLPEFTLSTRGHWRFMQIKSITDPEIHVRRLRLIDGGPVLLGAPGESEEGEEDVLPNPAIGTLSESDLKVSIPITFPGAAPTGYKVRVDFAVNGSEPDATSGLWQTLGYLDAAGTLITPVLPAGQTVWVRARGELIGRRPTPWTAAESIVLADTPGLREYELSFATPGLAQARWVPNAYAEGLRFEVSTGIIGHTASFGTYDDVDSDSPLTLNFTGEELDYGEEAYIRVTAYPGFSAGSVTGSPGSVYTLRIERPEPADSADHALGDHTDTFFTPPERRPFRVVPTWWPEDESSSPEGFYLTHGGVPSGGDVGQVLKKQSDDDFDYDWGADSGAGGGYDEGTGFPGSPSANDKFYRTDRNILYFYDGTRWLSTQVHTLHMSPHTAFPSLTGTVTSLMRSVNVWTGLYDIWAEDAAFMWNYSASGGWTLNLSKFDGTTQTNIATHTPTFVDTQWYSIRVAIGAVVASSIDMFVGGATENSGSATLTFGMSMTYRLIG